MKELLQQLNKFRELNEQSKELEKQIQEVRTTIKTLTQDKDIKTENFNISFKRIKRLDIKAVKEKFPSVYNTCTKLTDPIMYIKYGNSYGTQRQD